MGIGKRERRMCSLYSNLSTADEMRRMFRVGVANCRLGDAPALPAVWPGTMAPVVRLSEGSGPRELLNMGWGFLTPRYSKRDGRPIRPAVRHNAKAERVGAIPLWRSSFMERRCLVPATSFRETGGGRPAADVWFAMAPERDGDARPRFAFAGIWRPEPPDLGTAAGTPLTYSVITTAAVGAVATVHSRMPVILAPDGYDRWLRGGVGEARALLAAHAGARLRIAREGIGVREDAPDAPPPVTPASGVTRLRVDGLCLDAVGCAFLQVVCDCGHTGEVPVAALRERYGRAARIRDALGATRCSRCGGRAIKAVYAFDSP